MTEVAAPAARPPLWRNVRVLRFAGQAVFVILLVIVGREMLLNLRFGVGRQGVDLSFSFLDSRAGFEIGEGIGFTPNQSFLDAYVVGVVNTLRVAVAGIVLASLLGLVMGVARLSPNWLVRKIAQVYVEAIRNTPVLLQIIFWWAAVFLTLPPIDESVSVGDAFFLSNRGTAIPRPSLGDGAELWGLFLLGGLAAATGLWRWRTRFSERTGAEHHRVMWSAGTFAAVAVAGWFVASATAGDPLRADVPVHLQDAYRGGLQLSPEFSALLVALVVYTSAFIAEIVRGSIQSVEKGQKEAAMALGLTPFQQLRFVVLPQALRIAIPPVNSQYLNLTKNTSLAIAIGYPELAAVSETIVNQAGRATQMLVIMMGTYLAMTLSISALMNVLNRAVAPKGARR